MQDIQTWRALIAEGAFSFLCAFPVEDPEPKGLRLRHMPMIGGFVLSSKEAS